MPGLAETLLAFGLMLGGHEMGHGLEADRQNVPFKSGLVWHAGTNDKKKLARIANAGLEGQGILSRALLGTKIEKSVRVASALNNLGYALIPGSVTGGVGDVRMIEQTKGKKARQFAQGALVASAISDIVRESNSNIGLGYGQSTSGTPMLILRGRF